MSENFYALATSVANLATITADGETNLLIDPHPNVFEEAAEMVGYSGTGRPVEAGFPGAEWTWDVPLSAAEWKQLMDFTGAAAYVIAYIRTRTNQMQVSGEYQYKNYSAIAHRPTGESLPPYRFENVRMEFTRLIEV